MPGRIGVPGHGRCHSDLLSAVISAAHSTSHMTVFQSRTEDIDPNSLLRFRCTGQLW